MHTDPSTPANDPDLSALGRELLETGSSKPSGPWVPPTAEELHKLLPEYDIVKMLGRGGMGAVYMGRQTSLDRPVAIKILSAALEESDKGFAERFKNEARALGKLNHPGIVGVYDFGTAPGGLLYIVMEYVDGTDVARMIAAQGRLHTDHAMAITAHVCDALAYAHERGIIHRDIKPANIMVGYDGEVKVADFGLAKVRGSSGETLGLTQSGMAMGTLHYMAPEALMLGTAVDHRADIYAVGVMLYQMLTGKVPHGMFKMPSLQVPGLDPRYDGIIAKAMMEDREARYQQIGEMRTSLDSILTQPVVKVEPATPDTPAQAAMLPTNARPQRPGGRQPARLYSDHEPPRGSLAWLWVTVVVLTVLGGIAYMMMDRPPVPAKPTLPPQAVVVPIASIAISSPAPLRILKLETGQPRLYDSTPLRVIESVRSDLAGWQFTSIPQRIENEYEIRVIRPGTIYAFGGKPNNATRETIFGLAAAQWEPADDAITGAMIHMCYRREVKAGDIIRLKAFELQLAAPTILYEKPAPVVSSTSQPAQPSPPPTPVPQTPPAAPPLASSANIPAPATTMPTPQEVPADANDWQPLFPNNSLAEWKGDVAGYRLANGILTSTINGGDLISPKEYGNFHLKFDLRLSSGANNGIGVWCADNNQGYKYVAHTGFEIQLIDDNLPSFSKGQPWHLHGALSYFLAPRAKPMGPVGSWNTHEIRMEGTRLTVSINNVTVIDQELPTGDPVAEGSRRHRLDLSKKRGHLVFCGMKGPVDFRNVMIKDLDASRAVAPPIPSPPAVVTSATTWIDSTGRSIQAKFVRIEGANVILEIGGNQTRVPLARLSPASQDQARQFATLPQSSATPKVRTVTTSSTANDPGNDGFISLLDANQPGDWLQAGPGRMDIKNGVSTNSSPTKWGVAIYTKQKFSDFILKAEFKGMGSKFNSGLWLRIADYRSDFLSIHASKYEVGIRYSSGELRTTTGAIWGVQPARVDALKANDWNELEVTVTGQRYVVKLNGQLVNDFTGNKGLSGYIGLEENFEGPVQFRNVRVKPLP